jgi:hypothetical protein
LWHLGPKKKRATEAVLERDIIVSYVKQMFKNPEFPNELYVALDMGAMAVTGDLIWPNIDCEHPFDFIPIARIDDLLLNLPTKEEFLLKLGAENLEGVTPEAEETFWNAYEFEFAQTAQNVKLTWE